MHRPQVIQRANASQYGLAAGIFAKDIDVINTLTRSLKVGAARFVVIEACHTSQNSQQAHSIRSELSAVHQLQHLHLIAASDVDVPWLSCVMRHAAVSCRDGLDELLQPCRPSNAIWRCSILHFPEIWWQSLRSNVVAHNAFHNHLAHLRCPAAAAAATAAAIDAGTDVRCVHSRRAGYKKSGIGREMGGPDYGLAPYVQMKAVYQKLANTPWR